MQTDAVAQSPFSLHLTNSLLRSRLPMCAVLLWSAEWEPMHNKMAILSVQLLLFETVIQKNHHKKTSFRKQFLGLIWKPSQIHIIASYSKGTHCIRRAHWSRPNWESHKIMLFNIKHLKRYISQKIYKYMYNHSQEFKMEKLWCEKSSWWSTVCICTYAGRTSTFKRPMILIAGTTNCSENNECT